MTTRQKTKVFEETFYSREYDTREMAEWKLERIREGHPESSGWEEISAEIIPCGKGKWKAARHHIKYEYR